jgi:hypothetical protein
MEKWPWARTNSCLRCHLAAGVEKSWTFKVPSETWVGNLSFSHLNALREKALRVLVDQVSIGLKPYSIFLGSRARGVDLPCVNSKKLMLCV